MVRHHRGFGEKALQTRSISTASHEETVPLSGAGHAEKNSSFFGLGICYITVYISVIYLVIYMFNSFI